MKRIVVGYDGRGVSRDSLVLGRLLGELLEARLTIAAVFPYEERQMGRDAYRHALAEDRDRLLAQIVEELGGTDAMEMEALGDHSAPRALHELIERSAPELVVVGSSERAEVGRILAGTTAERLLHGSPSPVAVAPRGFREREPGVRVIAVGFDGSAESSHALQLGAELAGRAEAAMRIVTVLPRQGATGPEAMQARTAWRAELRDRAHDEASALPGELRALPIVEEGDPAKVLLAAIELGVDLIVVGSRGYGPMRRVLLGSVSSALMRGARCPVIVVPRTAA